MRLERVVTIVNRAGMHVRPAQKLAETAGRFASEVMVHSNGQSVNAKSIIEVLTLAATKGSQVVVIAEGHDAEKAVAAIEELVHGGFGEEV